jgi:hypothetical protein
MAPARGLQNSNFYTTPRDATTPSNRSGPDRSKINTSQEHEVRYWTKALGVSEEELKRAVQSVGNSADKVREHLGKRSR